MHPSGGLIFVKQITTAETSALYNSRNFSIHKRLRTLDCLERRCKDKPFHSLIQVICCRT